MAVNKTKEIDDTIDKPHITIKPGDLVMVILVAASWGVAFVGMKAMVQDAPPFMSGGLRFLIGSLPLLLIALQPQRLGKLRGIDFAKFALVGFFQTAVLFGINFTALKHVPAGVSSIILNTNPFFVAIFAHLLIKGDKLNRQKSLGLLLGFGGVLVLVLGGKGFGEVEPYWPAILLLAAADWAFSSILIKLLKFQDMVSLTAWQSLFGAIVLLGAGFGLETEPVHWTGSFIFWTLYVALIGSSFAWWAWSKLLGRYSASRISVFLFLIPIFGVLSSVVLLGESLSYNMLLGGALVAFGIVVVNIRWGKVDSRWRSANQLPGQLKGCESRVENPEL
jgi:drug/metabolite transporter (DMT)-like permease